MKSLNNNIGRSIIIVFLTMYLIVAYWLFWPYNPIEVKEPIQILESSNIVPGGYIVYELNINKRLSLPANISKQLINDFVITYSPIIGNIPIGKRNMKVKLKIPESAECGRYRLKWESIYKVNPIREISVIAWSDYFIVKKS